MKRILHLIIICTAVLCSCSDEVNDCYSEPTEIRLTQYVSHETRSTNNSLQNDAIADGQTVGVFIGRANVDYMDIANNAPYTVTAVDGLIPLNSSSIFPNEGKIVVNAYLPYTEAMNEREHRRFSVIADQSTDENYIKSDLMLGAADNNPVAKTSTQIPIGFKHKMAKLKVHLRAGVHFYSKDITGSTLKTSPLFTTVDIDIANGTTSTVYDDNLKEEIVLGKFTASDRVASALIAPQTVSAGTKLLCLTFADENKEPLYYTLPQGYTFEGGKEYTIEINKDRIDKVDIGVTVTFSNIKYRVWFAKTNFTMSGPAEKETDYGDFFAWACSEPFYESYHLDNDNKVVVETWKEGKTEGYTEANNLTGYGSPYKDWNEQFNMLDEHDIVKNMIGDGWVIPPMEVWNALGEAKSQGIISYSYCEVDGIAGLKIENVASPNKYVILPYTPYLEGTEIKNGRSFYMSSRGIRGYRGWFPWNYWEVNYMYAMEFSFNGNTIEYVKTNTDENSMQERYLGIPIRPVMLEPIE